MVTNIEYSMTKSDASNLAGIAGLKMTCTRFCVNFEMMSMK